MDKGWITTEYKGTEYTVPVTGRDHNLGVALTEIPDTAHAMAYLLQDGNLGVPGGRYGSDTVTCAEIALILADVHEYANGEARTYYGLDADMGFVVNSSDDVAYTLYEYGELVREDFDITRYLSDDDIAEQRERHVAEWGE